MVSTKALMYACKGVLGLDIGVGCWWVSLEWFACMEVRSVLEVH